MTYLQKLLLSPAISWFLKNKPGECWAFWQKSGHCRDKLTSVIPAIWTELSLALAYVYHVRLDHIKPLTPPMKVDRWNFTSVITVSEGWLHQKAYGCARWFVLFNESDRNLRVVWLRSFAMVTRFGMASGGITWLYPEKVWRWGRRPFQKCMLKFKNHIIGERMFENDVTAPYVANKHMIVLSLIMFTNGGANWTNRKTLSLACCQKSNTQRKSKNMMNLLEQVAEASAGGNGAWNRNCGEKAIDKTPLESTLMPAFCRNIIQTSCSRLCVCGGEEGREETED